MRYSAWLPWLVVASLGYTPCMMAAAKTGKVFFDQSSSTTLTLYQNRGIVQQSFDILPDEKGQLILEGMVNNWDEDSLDIHYQDDNRSIGADRVWWHSQGLNRDSLYGRLVGKPVELIGGGLNVPVQGEMLAYDKGMALVQGSNGRQYVVDWHDSQGFRLASRDKLFSDDDYTNRIHASFNDKITTNNLRVNYITSSLSYSSHYRMVLSDNKTASLDLSALLENHSSKDFSDASVRLVAGDIYATPVMARGLSAMSMDAASTTGTRVGEVLVMPVSESLQLKNNTSQQVHLYDRQNIKLDKRYLLEVYGRSNARKDMERPHRIFRFKADADLPAAQVTVLEKDGKGQMVISSESRLDQTTAGDIVHLSLGDAMAVRVERKRLSSKSEGNELITTWQAMVYNDRNEAISLIIRDQERSLLRLGNVKGGKLEGAPAIRIDVPAGESKQVSYSAFYSSK
ncbi:hypothetical protein CI610_00511 [invertebrate metagenome]|uniref:DUF4139 domain-containing protein n=1 Tax=invertebrate metagenome TaxID=1711999 RepID=A0A2H9TB55_9ZZZZ